MKEKLQNFISTTKGKATVFGTTVATTMSIGINAFAAEASVDVAAQITTGLQNTATQFIGIVGAVAPIGLTIFGAVFCWKKGVKFFKTIGA